jgi:hypothetical protein
MPQLKKFHDKNYVHFVSFKTFGRLTTDNNIQRYIGHQYFKDEKWCEILIEEFEFAEYTRIFSEINH